MDNFKVFFGVIFGYFRDSLITFFGRSLGHFWVVFGHFRVFFGGKYIIFFWITRAFFGVIPGHFWDHLLTFLGIFR